MNAVAYAGRMLGVAGARVGSHRFPRVAIANTTQVQTDRVFLGCQHRLPLLLETRARICRAPQVQGPAARPLGKAEGTYRARNLRNLSLAMATGIARIGDQVCQWSVLDL